MLGAVENKNFPATNAGGNGNAAIGGDAGALSSILGLIGSDVIATGGTDTSITMRVSRFSPGGV